MTERLLFVDDEASIRHGFERNLGFDYDLDTAESGAKGLELLEKNEYAVVITDMRMPGMSGLEFLVRAHRMHLQSVFMMLTGNVDTETVDAAYREGRVFRFMNKPCPADELKVIIAEALEEYERRSCLHPSPLRTL